VPSAGYAGLCCGKIGLFCGEIGLFCGKRQEKTERDSELDGGYAGLFCGKIGLFCGEIGLFCGKQGTFWRSVAVCPKSCPARDMNFL